MKKEKEKILTKSNIKLWNQNFTALKHTDGKNVMANYLGTFGLSLSIMAHSPDKIWL